ncbi:MULTISPECIES: GDP-L-fucose synthase family protein [unclassified Pseudomonas]|uniref:GDP-L-fucose synthase family protein n=1 Tax=unclassified Pseudomonas TaxID=196821 RepID=UPI00081BD8FB|nr:MULTISPECIES: GDP-L-fucose synthase [unclassified Pseudomonas]MDT9630461.1 GDP-L-fucose synthase [Pseudomonas sp. JV449]MDT9631462.1 GDP-L-fucose synthase [Pseudomonas sp. JV449]
MSTKRILLTGGGGMVGRNLLDHPEIGEFEVLAPRSSELDLRDFLAVQAYVERHKPDFIIHAAGKVGGIQANVREPVNFLRDNLDIGRNVVSAAQLAGVPRLINLGSSCMYPRNHTGSLSEDMVLTGELEPTNEGYALAKIVTARLCDYISRENQGLQYKTLIPCNIFGRFDKFDPAHSHLLPAIIHKLHIAKKTGAPSVDVWGDGSARREFMYGGDLADALIHAIKHFESVPRYMNIGLGNDHSINDYYRTAATVMGYEGTFEHDLTKPVGMARKLVNIERQISWGWKPRHSLQEGIEKTYSYYLEHQQ